MIRYLYFVFCYSVICTGEFVINVEHIDANNTIYMNYKLIFTPSMCPKGFFATSIHKNQEQIVYKYSELTQVGVLEWYNKKYSKMGVNTDYKVEKSTIYVQSTQKVHDEIDNIQNAIYLYVINKINKETKPPINFDTEKEFLPGSKITEDQKAMKKQNILFIFFKSIDERLIEFFANYIR